MAEPAGHAQRLDALTADLLVLIDRVWVAVVTEQARLAAAWPTDSPPVRRRRLAKLRRDVDTLMRDVEAATAAQLGPALAGAWSAGASDAAAVLARAAVYQDLDTASLAVIARDTYADVLARTSYVRTSTKALIRDLARLATAEKTTTGLPALQAAARLEATLERSGITAITYRDGSRHGLPEYTRMLLRTKTAETYQTAGLEQTGRLGVRFVEILDGPGCGLDGHDDPTKADGLILGVEQAMRYKTSHPNCRRVSTPRPDLESDADAAAARAAQRPPILPVGLQRPPAPTGPVSRLSDRGARTAAGVLDPASGAQRAAAGRPRRPTLPGRPARPPRPR